MGKNKEKWSYDILAQQQKEASKQYGKISNTLSSNIAAYKEPDLFDNLPDKGAAIIASDEANLIDRNGKGILLSRRQLKLLEALSHFITHSSETDEEVNRAIEAIKNGERRSATTVTRPISIKELTKFVEPDGKARAKQKQMVIDDLKQIADLRQVQTFDWNGKKFAISSPLIMIGETVTDLTPDKELDLDFMNITYPAIFFMGLDKKFSVTKPEFFRIWGKKGSGTDTQLFNMLYYDLKSRYSYYLSAAKKAKREKRSDTDLRRAATYEEYAYNIRKRCPTDYESTRKQKADFTRDLFNALNALRDLVEIITEYEILEKPQGRLVRFIFNLDFYKEPETLVELPKGKEQKAPRRKTSARKKEGE